MPANPTSPSIYVAQDEPANQELIHAFRVTYRKVKGRAFLRLSIVAAVAAALTVVAAFQDRGQTQVGVVTGLILLIANVSTWFTDTRAVAVAVAMQEQFDTNVFGLPWDKYACPQPPSPNEVAAAARRYTGEPTFGWYSDTKTVERPLDVLVCQQANAAWGRSVHTKWAWLVTAALIALIVLPTLAMWLAGASITTVAAIFLLPWSGVMAELGRMALANFISANDKTELEKQMREDWETGLASGLDVGHVRAIQSKIAHVRAANAHVPDWFHKVIRDTNEADMQTTTARLVAEATNHGRA